MLPATADQAESTYYLASAVHLSNTRHYTAFVRGPYNPNETKEQQVIWQFDSFPDQVVRCISLAEFEENFAESLEVVAFLRL